MEKIFKDKSYFFLNFKFTEVRLCQFNYNNNNNNNAFRDFFLNKDILFLK